MPGCGSFGIELSRLYWVGALRGVAILCSVLFVLGMGFRGWLAREDLRLMCTCGQGAGVRCPGSIADWLSISLHHVHQEHALAPSIICTMGVGKGTVSTHSQLLTCYIVSYSIHWIAFCQQCRASQQCCSKSPV